MWRIPGSSRVICSTRQPGIGQNLFMLRSMGSDARPAKHQHRTAQSTQSAGEPFRQGLSALGLLWAVGIPRIQKVYPPEVKWVPPPVTRGGPRKTLIPDQEAIAAEAMLAKASWRQVTWRRGTKGPLRAKFAVVRVRVADGPEVRLQGRTGQHLPGDEVWLVGEHRSSGERKYYLSNLPPDTPLKRLAALIKARWVPNAP